MLFLLIIQIKFRGGIRKMYVYAKLLSLEQFTTTMKHLSYLNNDPINEKKKWFALSASEHVANHHQRLILHKTHSFFAKSLYTAHQNTRR